MLEQILNLCQIMGDAGRTRDKMKAFIYSPYLDSLGGGERYMMTVASVLSEAYEVDVYGDHNLKDVLQKRFGIDLSKVNFIDTNSKGDGYDLSFWLSDGSIPLLHARNNFLHFQMPFRDVGGRSLLTKMKLIRVKKIVCNSNFTKYFIDDEFGIDSTVLYPPVDTKLFHPKRKENMILYVGRFSQLTQRKGQDILIKAFGKLVKKGINDWNLV